MDHTWGIWCVRRTYTFNSHNMCIMSTSLKGYMHSPVIQNIVVAAIFCTGCGGYENIQQHVAPKDAGFTDLRGTLVYYTRVESSYSLSSRWEVVKGYFVHLIRLLCIYEIIKKFHIISIWRIYYLKLVLLILNVLMTRSLPNQ